ncbi:beta-1,3-galactosyltransferase 4 [Microcaecilia unicolor]|uniref:Hexosyltransferase n=1 Tax=Microcaecilia unicolor TaxID=1415580 RepID=A0A6P7XBX6_9AMPH|nr:beta-1,3-galactosyltransferase 4 [Microcaecilia unicolor]
MPLWGLPMCVRCLRHRHWQCQLLLLGLGGTVVVPALILTGLFEEFLSFSVAPFLRGGSSSIHLNWRFSGDLYHIANGGACHSPVPPFLLNFVVSSPSNFEARQVIRQTWGSTRELDGLRILTLFALGQPQAVAVQAQLDQEFTEHRDLVQGTFRDTYRNLTLKTLMLLRWASTFCPEAHFLLKVDDDVFVNTKRLVGHLRALGNLRPRGIYLGRIHWNVRPIRDPSSQHYTAEAEFPGDSFPLYCSGTSYVVSGDVARQVAAVAVETPTVALEDVYVGICARKVGVAPQHSAWFSGSTHYPLDTCCYQHIFTSHRMTPTLMKRAWGLLAPGKESGCSWLLPRLELLRCRLIS